MNNEVKEQIEIYIKLLHQLPSDDLEYETWVPTCIECLEFALNNEQLLSEKPELYKDTLRTLNLLYSWIKKEKEWAYIELRQKFKKWYSPEEMRESLRIILDRMRNIKEVEGDVEVNDIINFKDQEGDFKPMVQILDELSEQFNML